MISEDIKWKILSLLLARGEFNLNHMGFENSQEESKPASLVSKKKNICLQFQAFLYEMLKHTLFILG